MEGTKGGGRGTFAAVPRPISSLVPYCMKNYLTIPENRVYRLYLSTMVRVIS
jgi:hypothetical protein